MSLDRLRPFSVYLATPYTKYPGGIDKAFRDASALAGKLIKEGIKVYSPIAHTHPIAIYGGIDPLDHTIWIPFDELMMKKMEVLAVAKLETWETSFGVSHEIEVFRSDEKPVFLLDPITLEVT